MARAHDRVDSRATECGTFGLEQLDAGDHGVLLRVVEALEPGSELIGVEHLPRTTKAPISSADRGLAVYPPWDSNPEPAD